MSEKKTNGKGKAAKAAKAGKGKAGSRGGLSGLAAGRRGERRLLTAAEYRALEKAAHSLTIALKVRRKFQFAVLNATERVEKMFDDILTIARGDAG